MLKKDRVFILKSVKYGEADLILTVLNSQGALISLMAKGARKSKKRFFGGVLEPSHYVEIVYKQGRESNEERTLHYLQEAQLKKSFDKLRSSYDRLEMAFYFLKTLEKISIEGGDDSKENFNLLGNALKALETSEDLSSLKLHFDMKLLNAQGVLPPEVYEAEIVGRPIAHHGQLKSILGVDRNDIELNVNHLVSQYVGR